MGRSSSNWYSWASGGEWSASNSTVSTGTPSARSRSATHTECAPSGSALPTVTSADVNVGDSCSETDTSAHCAFALEIALAAIRLQDRVEKPLLRRVCGSVGQSDVVGPAAQHYALQRCGVVRDPDSERPRIGIPGSGGEGRQLRGQLCACRVAGQDQMRRSRASVPRARGMRVHWSAGGPARGSDGPVRGDRAGRRR